MIFYLGNVLSLGTKPNLTWDTLFGVLNLEDFPVRARFRFWNEQTGKLVVWPDGSDHQDVVIQPRQSWAATLLDDNGFDLTPEGFTGSGEIEVFDEEPPPFGSRPVTKVHVWSMLSDGLWKSDSPSIEAPVLTQLQPASEWVFPYAIPRWSHPEADPPLHCGPDAYTTGILVQNFSVLAPAPIEIHYLSNPAYPDFGSEYIAAAEIPPRCGLRKLMTELLPGLPERTEGYIAVKSLAPPSLLLPSLIIATESFRFSAGQTARIAG